MEDIASSPLRKTKLRAALGLLLLSVLVCAKGINAASVDDYHGRIDDAVNALERLTPSYDSEDRAQREQRTRATIARVLETLPAKETVWTKDAAVNVDNTWLHEALRDYEAMDHADPRSTETLAGVTERLRALAERLAETESRKPTDSASKGDNKARLAEILRRPEYNRKVEQGSALGRLWARFLRWLSSILPEAEPIRPGSARTISAIAQLLVIVFALAVIAYVAWKLAPRILRNRRKKRTAKREARIVLGERLEPEQTAADLLAQADALARTGELRAAIRKAYIALLCELADRKLIGLARHKTNRDYLDALRQTNLYGSLRNLTVSFENHWYGFAPTSPEDWTNFRAGYQSLMTLG